jgi:hypothetical protein
MATGSVQFLSRSSPLPILSWIQGTVNQQPSLLQERKGNYIYVVKLLPLVSLRDSLNFSYNLNTHIFC